MWKIHWLTVICVNVKVEATEKYHCVGVSVKRYSICWCECRRYCTNVYGDVRFVDFVHNVCWCESKRAAWIPLL